MTDDVQSLSWESSVPPSLLSTIQAGVLGRTAYRGLRLLKSPFDIVIYMQLFQQLMPRTLIEIGTHQGGSTVWFADTLDAIGAECRIVTVDLEPPDLVDPRITLLAGDANDLGQVLTPALLAGLARPFLVIDDSAHLYDTTLAVLRFFDPVLASGDYIVVEDGSLAWFPEPVYLEYENGPNRAVIRFLEERGDAYVVDRQLCDFYGTNVTYNPNGWLRKR